MAKNAVVNYVDVLFLKDAAPKDFSGVTYAEGEVYSMAEDSANHWVTRGIAQLVVPVAENAANDVKSKKTATKVDAPASQGVNNSEDKPQTEDKS